MRVLLIEDSVALRQAVAKALKASGFAVDTTGDGAEGWQMTQDHDYDVIVLDIMLPGMDGREVLRRLRAAGKETPVLFLTAKDTVEDRVAGLRLGADDYLVKSFAIEELIARVEALGRRKYAKRSAEAGRGGFGVGPECEDRAARRRGGATRTSIVRAARVFAFAQRAGCLAHGDRGAHLRRASFADEQCGGHGRMRVASCDCGIGWLRAAHSDAARNGLRHRGAAAVRSIRTQLLAWLLPGFAVVCVAAGVGVYFSERQAFEADLDARLGKLAGLARLALRTQGTSGANSTRGPTVRVFSTREEFKTPGQYFEQWTVGGAVERKSPNLGTIDLPRPAEFPREEMRYNAALDNGDRVRVSAVRVAQIGSAPPADFAVALSRRDGDARLSRLIAKLVIGGLACCAVLCGLLALALRSSMRPLVAAG